MTDLVLGIDVSKWNDPKKVPYVFLKEHGFRFAIPKFSMGGGIDVHAREHSEKIVAAGFDLGGYHWCDPTQNWDTQIEHYLGLVDELKPKILALDVEQWWADWNKYGQYIRGEIPSSSVPRLTEAEIVANMAHLTNKVIEANIVPKDRIVIYTARWFSNMYPSLGPAISRLGVQIWPAHYRTNIPGTNWKIQEYDWQTFYSLVPVDQKPLMPVGGPEDYLFWQFTSAPTFLGVRLDCNFYNGSIAEYDAWIGNEPGEPDPEPPDGWEEAYQSLLKRYNELQEQHDLLEQMLMSTGARLEKITTWATGVNYKEDTS